MNNQEIWPQGPACLPWYGDEGALCRHESCYDVMLNDYGRQLQLMDEPLLHTSPWDERPPSGPHEAQGPLCAYWRDESAEVCWHDSCYVIVADQGRDLLTQYASILVTEGPAPIPEHDCPVAAFFNDPITREYGLGGDWDEWSRVISCRICDIPGIEELWNVNQPPF